MTVLSLTPDSPPTCHMRVLVRYASRYPAPYVCRVLLYVGEVVMFRNAHPTALTLSENTAVATAPGTTPSCTPHTPPEVTVTDATTVSEPSVTTMESSRACACTREAKPTTTATTASSRGTTQTPGAMSVKMWWGGCILHFQGFGKTRGQKKAVHDQRV